MLLGGCLLDVDSADEWIYGAEALLDQARADGWFTTWSMLNDSFSAPARPVEGSTAPFTVPAIGYSFTDDAAGSSFELPASIAAGSHRLCIDLTRTASSAGGARTGRVCAALTIV